MNKKIVLTGASGMIGSLVLQKCLENENVSEVVSFVREKTKIEHPKLNELVITDFLNYEELLPKLKEIDIIYYCLGVYTGTVNKEKFIEITVDYPYQLGKLIAKQSVNCHFCLLSGQGADRTEKSKVPFAKQKGAVENKLSSLEFVSFFALRPAYIYPVTKRKEPNMSYTLFRILYPLVSLISPKYTITSIQLVNVMYRIGMEGYDKEILENIDLLELS